MRKPTVDDVINGYFERFRPTPEEVREMIEAWPVLAEAAKAAWHPEQKGKEVDV